MKLIRTLLLLTILLPLTNYAQKTSIMFTYSQSKFLFSPGLEANYFFHPKLGFQAGVSSYFLDYNPEQMVNINTGTRLRYFGQFYNSNLGLCGLLRNYKNFKIGWTLGWKMYFGPNFQPLHFYESEGYYIYYDYANGKFNHGLDLGLMLYGNKNVAGIKFDTARNVFRFLLGWSF
tara:strand:- start:53 stop:577 length:525 start_codon:yes stop_codon:yes gene_type:complete